MNENQTNEESKLLPFKGLDLWLTVSAIAYNFILLLFSVRWIFTNSFSSIKSNLSMITGIELNEQVSYTLFFAGMLGGSFYCLRSIYVRLAKRSAVEDSKKLAEFNMRVWLFWYFFRPWQGGVLALIVMCLVNGNLMAAKNLDTNAIKSFYTLIAIGFLCGLGSSEVIGKIQEIIAVIFARAKGAEDKGAK